MRYSILIIALIFTGCTGFTSVGIAEKLSAERTQRYTMGVDAHANAVRSVMESLSKIDRGGMKIETTEDGRIKAISYTDKLDMNVISKALETPQYKEEKVQSILSEVGDFMLKATNMIVPVASIYYGSINHVATQEAQVLMNASNNEAQSSMINSYTGNFSKDSIATTDTSKDSTVFTSVSSDVQATNISTDTSINNDTSSSITSPYVPYISTDGTAISVTP